MPVIDWLELVLDDDGQILARISRDDAGRERSDRPLARVELEMKAEDVTEQTEDCPLPPVRT